MIPTLLLVSLAKGLKLAAYLILIAAHAWTGTPPEVRHRLVRLGYWLLAIMAVIETWR